MYSKKIIGTMVALCLALASFASCGTAPAHSTSSAHTAPTPLDANTVNISMSSDIDSLDPMLSAASDTGAVMRNVFDSLLSYDTKGNMVPCLAQDYTISDDGLTYTFSLKEGIVFHDGSTFDSADALYSYNRLAGKNGYEPASTTLSDLIDTVTAPDAFTLQITLNQVDAAFLTKCTYFIIPDGYEESATKPIGTGPYKFVEYVQGEKLVFSINEDYNTMESKTPTVETVVVKIMTDTTATLMALQTGALDVTTILQQDVANLESDFTILEYPQNMVQVFALNNKVPGLDNVLVRKAIAAAINKQEIIMFACGGAGTQAETFLSPIMEAYYNKDLAPHIQDVALAKQLLAQAGYADGFTFTVKVPSNYQTHVDTAQVISEQLRAVGITMNIELVEWATWLEEVYKNENYEATVCAQTGKLDPNDFLNRFSTSYARNYFNFENARYDELIALASTTTDDAQRKAYYIECQQILVDEAAAIFIQDPSGILAIHPRVEGYLVYPASFVDFSALTIV